MEMFRGRALAAAAAACAVGATAGAFCGGRIAAALTAAALSVCIACLFFLRGKNGYRAFCVLLIAFSFCFVFLSARLQISRRHREAAEYYGGNLCVTGIVTDRVGSYPEYSVFTVRLTSVNGTPCRVRARMECGYASDLQPGFSFTLTGASAESALRDEEYAASMLSDGIFVTVSSEAPATCTITAENAGTVWERLSRMGRRVNDRLAFELRHGIGGDPGDLAAAMLLGRSSRVGEEIRRDFRRAGVSHLLAVSGLHMSMITAVLGFFLSRAGMHRSLRLCLLSVFACCYLFVLGFPVSAVRSFLMMAAATAGYFCGTDTDGICSLSLAVCAILFVTPGAIFDGGFILSVCATLGIVAVVPYFTGRKKENGKKKSLLRGAAGVLLTVLSANLLTVFPVSRMFGELSLAAFPANLILPLLGEAVLFAALLYLPLCMLPTGLFAEAVRLPASALLFLSSRISQIRGITVSLERAFVPYLLIPCTILSLILLSVKLRHRSFVFAPAAAAVLAFAVCSGISARSVGSAECEVLAAGTNCVVAVRRGTEAVITDVSTGALTPLKEAYGELRKNGVTELSGLVLTHYHLKHCSSAARLMAGERVRVMWLPTPVTEEDAAAAIRLCELAERFGTECRMYAAGEKINPLEKVSMELSGPVYITDGTHPAIYFKVGGGRKNMAFIGKSAWDCVKEEAYTRCTDVDFIYIGSHGPSCGSAPDGLASVPDEICIADRAVLEKAAADGGAFFDLLKRVRTLCGAEKYTVFLPD